MFKNLRFIPFSMCTAFQVNWQKLWVFSLLYFPFQKVKKGEQNKVLLKVYRRAYYLSVWYPLVYANTFATLYNKPLKASEKKAAIYAAAIAVMFDALFDDLDFDLKKLAVMIDSPNNYYPETRIEQLMLQLHKNMLKHVLPERVDNFKQMVHAVFKAQTLSLKQKENPTAEELTDITLQKGGYSALLFRSLLNYPLFSETDKEVVYLMGGFFQLLNDVTNTSSDIRTQTTTLATYCKTPVEINNCLNQFRSNVIQKIAILPEAPNWSKQKIGFKFYVLSIWGYAHIKKLHFEQVNGITNPKPFKWTIPYTVYGFKLMFFRDYENLQFNAIA